MDALKFKNNNNNSLNIVTDKEQIKILSCLSLEMTRQCNMNCDFCSRGQAQKIDITQEIIDKTLNEVKDCYICQLRLNGGEPFLNADMIEYLVNSIIEKQIRINKVFIFTNATILNKKIRNSLLKLSKYLVDIDNGLNKYKSILNKFGSTEVYHYTDIENDKITIVISTDYHNNKEYIDSCKNYYSNQNVYINVINQSEKSLTDYQNSIVVLSGNAIKNHKQILESKEIKLSNFRIIKNEYNIIDVIAESNNIFFISKAFTISANGNIFVGCMKSYDEVDNNPMFNILNCNNDFIDKVYNWCWEHPFTKKMNQIIENEQLKNWLINNGYSYIDGFSQNREILNSLNSIMLSMITIYEIKIKEVHKEYSKLQFIDAELLTICFMALQLLSDYTLGYPNLYLQCFLETFFELFLNYIDINNFFDKNWLMNTINLLIDKNNK